MRAHSPSIWLLAPLVKPPLSGLFSSLGPASATLCWAGTRPIGPCCSTTTGAFLSRGCCVARNKACSAAVSRSSMQYAPVAKHTAAVPEPVPSLQVVLHSGLNNRVLHVAIVSATPMHKHYHLNCFLHEISLDILHLSGTSQHVTDSFSRFCLPACRNHGIAN